MKKNWIAAVLIFGASVVYAQTLDSAIEDAAEGISGRLPEKSTVAMINFQSASAKLTDYVIDELNGKIANIGKIKPVERRQLNVIRSELNFNLSGEVSDESAQNIGRMLGAQYLILGSMEFIGNQYRMRFRAITVEAASIEYSFSQNVKSDTILQALLKDTNLLVDFTPSERWGASGLNLVFGLGSFIIERDMVGGGITAAVEGLGVVTMVAGQILYKARDYDPRDGDDQSILDSYYAYPFFIGLGAYVGGAIYGIIRAQTYHKPGAAVSMFPFDKFRLNLVSLNDKNFGLQVVYKCTFR